MITNPGPTKSPDLETNNDDHQISCLYFGFASNLSPRTIKQRCPSAMYAGLAVLKGWKFVISELGFGNIIPSTSSDDIVYGSLNFLSRRDEAALDRSEEIPHWHQKTKLKVVRLLDPSTITTTTAAAAAAIEGPEIEVTTYIDVERVSEGVISKDYIVWLRKAIDDGTRAGVPPEYFEKYFGRFLPRDQTVGKEDQIMMIRTMQLDKNDTAYVPSYMLR